MGTVRTSLCLVSAHNECLISFIHCKYVCCRQAHNPVFSVQLGNTVHGSSTPFRTASPQEGVQHWNAKQHFSNLGRAHQQPSDSPRHQSKMLPHGFVPLQPLSTTEVRVNSLHADKALLQAVPHMLVLCRIRLVITNPRGARLVGWYPSTPIRIQQQAKLR